MAEKEVLTPEVLQSADGVVLNEIPRKTERLELFAEFYNLSKDAQKSAVMAGYTPKTAKSYAYKLLDKAEVLGLIEQDLLRQAPKALRRVKSLSEGKTIGTLEKVTPQVVLDANKEILDRVHPKKQVIEQFSVNATLPPERVEQLFQRLRGARPVQHE